MKRMHIHVAVDNLERSILFYNALFGQAPSKTKSDYAKWMLEDPRINFAISSRGENPGVNHLGLQVDTAEELAAVRERLKAADLAVFDEGETVCCYAKSDKSWVQDPGGMPWEAYQTMADAELFSDRQADATEAACCTPSEKNTGCCAQ